MPLVQGFPLCGTTQDSVLRAKRAPCGVPIAPRAQGCWPDIDLPTHKYYERSRRDCMQNESAHSSSMQPLVLSAEALAVHRAGGLWPHAPGCGGAGVLARRLGARGYGRRGGGLLRRARDPGGGDAGAVRGAVRRGRHRAHAGPLVRHPRPAARRGAGDAAVAGHAAGRAAHAEPAPATLVQ